MAVRSINGAATATARLISQTTTSAGQLLAQLMTWVVQARRQRGVVIELPLPVVSGSKHLIMHLVTSDPQPVAHSVSLIRGDRSFLADVVMVVVVGTGKAIGGFAVAPTVVCRLLVIRSGLHRQQNHF
jgi:hypothetical protein